MPPGLPRVKAWKNCLVKEFANLDCKGPREYGLHPVKKISETVYSMGCIGCCEEHLDSSHESVKFRSSLDKTVGGLLPSSVKDQISFIARQFRANADEKSVDGAQNMLLDCLNCIVLATTTDPELDDSKTNSTQITRNNLADSESSIPKIDGAGFNQNSPAIQLSPNDKDLNDTAGSVSARKRKASSPLNQDEVLHSNSKSNKSRHVGVESAIFFEQGRKLDFNDSQKISTVSDVLKKLVPPKSGGVTESGGQCKSISFNHLVDSKSAVAGSSKDNSSQSSVDKFLRVNKKSFLPDKLRLKTSVSGSGVDISSQKSIHQENLTSSHVEFRWRENYQQTPIQMHTLPFTPDPTASTSLIPQKVVSSPRSSHGKDFHIQSSHSPPHVTKIDLSSGNSKGLENSPEVEIIGEVKFSSKCDELLNSSERIYNENSNIPSSSHSRRDKIWSKENF